MASSATKKYVCPYCGETKDEFYSVNANCYRDHNNLVPYGGIGSCQFCGTECAWTDHSVCQEYVAALLTGGLFKPEVQK